MIAFLPGTFAFNPRARRWAWCQALYVAQKLGGRVTWVVA